ncbi:MAG: bifunctional 2-methylcitrate synthase/citrate synthase [Microbacteriaceae bacterium]|nr:bifunctional 2-methylcitrate synthase/citrate synthase [Microbacteriaceae bacterium]
MEEKEIYKGLAGVPIDYTAISKVNAETNSLLYRGYPVQELAASKTFEEVAYLLWNGELPSESELTAFNERTRPLRKLDPRVAAAVDALPLDAHPMDVVRTAVSVIGSLDKDAWTLTENLSKAEALFAQIPAVVARDHRRRKGLEPVEPSSHLNYAEDFLWQTFGEEPEAAVADAFRVSLILYAEHSFNASTFTGRVIASTLSDIYSAVTGAIGALKGPLHGGANEAVLHIFNEIGFGPGAKERVKVWLDNALATKRKIMGFGHRVYKSGDSRVPTMRDAMVKMIEHYGRADVLELYEALEEDFVSRKGIYPNLDYPAGPTYHLMGFETEEFTPIFVAARVTGWTAHIIEQVENNALIRPLSVYNGVPERHVL